VSPSSLEPGPPDSPQVVTGVLDPALHISRGAVAGRFQGNPVYSHYGDIRSEYNRSRESLGLSDACWWSPIRLTGADRVAWLQGLTTQDVVGMRVGASREAVMLDPRGRTRFQFWIHVTEESVDLVTFLASRDDFVEALDSYLFAEDVEIDEPPVGCGFLAVRGPATGLFLDTMGLGVAPEPGTHRNLPDHGTIKRLITRSDTPEGGVDLMVAAGSPGLEEIVATVEGLGGGLFGLEAYQILRIETGVPWFGIDIDASVIPVEAGLTEFAITYDKGCYVGQETIARLRSRGQVNVSLTGLALEVDELPPPGTQILEGEKTVGRITSSIYSPSTGGAFGLGYVHRKAADPKILLDLANGRGHARLVTPPHMSRAVMR